jgi:hypothetical protein
MPASELITWEQCPTCRQPAAVGWWQGRPVEFDCPQGCSVLPDQLDVRCAHEGAPLDRRPL